MSLKSLNTLIKIEDTHIKELQQKMAALQAAIEACHTKKSENQERINKEKEFQANHPEIPSSLFIPHMEEEQKTIEIEITNLEENWLELQQILITHFEKQKSYEILLKRIHEEETRKLAQKEQQELDSLAQK